MSASGSEQRLIKLALFGGVFAAALLTSALSGAAWSSSASPGPSTSAPAEGAWSAQVIGPGRGQMEPCGCSGGQLGGVDRLSTALAMTPHAGLPVGPRFAAGGVVALEAEPHLPWAAAQLEIFWQAFPTLGFDAVGVASSELPQLDRFGELRFLLGETELVATNLQAPGLPGAPEALARSEGVVMLAFLPAGLSGSVQLPAPETPEGAEDAPAPAPIAWRTTEPLEALQALADAGQWDPSEPTLAFFEGERAGAEALAERLSPESFVLRVADEMEASATAGEGTAVLEVGSRLRQVLRLSGGVPEYMRVREQRVFEDMPGDASVTFLKGAYRSWLEYYDARAAVADSLPSEGTYVGDQACIACHTSQHEIWSASAHAHAWKTLQEDLRDGVPATVDPRCVTCHTSGYGRVGGFGSAVHSEELRWSPESPLVDVSCETCHGPGQAHVTTADKTKIDRGGEFTCLQCHDAENDPDFRYAEKWPLIEHLNR